MPMKASEIVVLSAAEMAALFFIIRLWRKRRRLSVMARLFWSVVLLIPILGIMAYGFCLNNPGEHPYDTDTTSGAAEAFGDGGDHGHV